MCVAALKRFSGESYANSCPLHSDKDSGVEGYPMREWQIQIFLVNSAGEEVPASTFDKATYNLHPSFPKPVHGQCSSFYSFSRSNRVRRHWLTVRREYQ